VIEYTNAKMTELAKEVSTITIEYELQKSYLDYAMSVIVGRALPDVRDGLKPVHRRVLYAMRELSNDWNKPYKKSARIVGDVIGKYHPHGDTAAYDTIVRMAQHFSMRYPLVDGQGNFGSVDGDSAAAMRYTEIRLAKIAHSLLSDLDKETVDFVPNYDGSESMPLVLPTRVPNLLVNGSTGIAVGMATNIPPHNLKEAITACIALLNKPDISIVELLQYVPGPDFPTAAIINGRGGIIDAYKTGRGKVCIRSRVTVEEDEDSGKQALIITELPYQVNKARLLEKIGELVKEKLIEGITAIRDESDKQGMRVVIELRRGEIADVVLNKLFINTQMEVSFGINMVALVNGQPRLLNLKQLLEEFLRHRREVVTRRTIFELRQARAQAHLLEGLGIALSNIDEIVALIKSSKTPAIAKEELMKRLWAAGMVQQLLEDQKDSSISRPADLGKEYGIQGESYRLSEAQAQAILELRLQRLTALEQDKIFGDYRELLEQIQKLLAILSDPDLLTVVVRDELLAVQEEFADARRTEIIDDQQNLTHEDLVTPENVVVTLSSEGYAKTQSLSDYQAQHRGGKGKSAAKIKETDVITNLFIAHTHDTLLCFSDLGKVYWIKVYLLPQGSRTARGRPLVNLLPLAANERVNTVLPISAYSSDKYIFMATANGIVKKVALDSFSNPRTSGIIAMDLQEGDHLVGATLTDGSYDILLFSDAGKAIRFTEQQVRPMGRTAQGVHGIKMQKGQKVISLVAVSEVEVSCAGAGDNAGEEGEKNDSGGAGQRTILTATANGYGKRTALTEYPTINRGGQGVIAIQTSERNGKVVSAICVEAGDEVMLISDQGSLVRTRADEISIISRNTQGVRLINLGDKESLVAIDSIPEAIAKAAAAAAVNSDNGSGGDVVGDGAAGESGDAVGGEAANAEIISTSV
jgi:DNA gyrase subunit A